MLKTRAQIMCACISAAAETVLKNSRAKSRDFARSGAYRLSPPNHAKPEKVNISCNNSQQSAIEILLTSFAKYPKHFQSRQHLLEAEIEGETFGPHMRTAARGEILRLTSYDAQGVPREINQKVRRGGG